MSVLKRTEQYLKALEDFRNAPNALKPYEVMQRIATSPNTTADIWVLLQMSDRIVMNKQRYSSEREFIYLAHGYDAAGIRNVLYFNSTEDIRSHADVLHLKYHEKALSKPRYVLQNNTTFNDQWYVVDTSDNNHTVATCKCEAHANRIVAMYNENGPSNIDIYDRKCLSNMAKAYCDLSNKLDPEHIKQHGIVDPVSGQQDALTLHYDNYDIKLEDTQQVGRGIAFPPIFFNDISIR